ncbi:MAG: hypothetical protein ACLRL0_00310, partial [Christensenellaceae bacterium]
PSQHKEKKNAKTRTDFFMLLLQATRNKSGRNRGGNILLSAYNKKVRLSYQYFGCSSQNLRKKPRKSGLWV